MSPKWIWFPQQRCLRNTFVLFRKEVFVGDDLLSAAGTIIADSRYRLTVNGVRIQWGPAPCDPRYQDLDPVDLRQFLSPGRNVIGVEVCYFGEGDGTYPMGSPGLLFQLEMKYSNGDATAMVSDDSWMAFLDRAHRPGMPKRWYLRALQEEFDARLHPYGWDLPGYVPDSLWLPAKILPGSFKMPSLFAGGPEYVFAGELHGERHAEEDTEGFLPSTDAFRLRPRDIPLLDEKIVVSDRLVDQGVVHWHRAPEDWFESRVPGSLTACREIVATKEGSGWIFPKTPPQTGYFLTFRFPEQLAGFPGFEIQAPAGTIVEMMVTEGHDPVNGPAWLDSYYYHWSRFICREGRNSFETFDYECFCWLQLHVRNASGKVKIGGVRCRRRQFPWPYEPQIQCGEPSLQRLFDASVNSLRNSASDSVQDGGGRERQQYSGDCGHQLQAIRSAFGETRLPARFLKTYSQGITGDGYFLDCWPAYDRLVRIMQRQMGTTVWGPLLDHGVGFMEDCWLHYFETGDQAALQEPYPRLLRFASYLEGLIRSDGLLPVENLGTPAVWIDHDGFLKQSHKRCAFNLYVAGAFRHSLAPMCRLFGDPSSAEHWEAVSSSLLSSSISAFWDDDTGLFCDNLPEVGHRGAKRFSDRTLSQAVLYGFVPEGRLGSVTAMLADAPSEMGLSYPPNAVWRYKALSRLGKIDVVLNDFRTRWATMQSVVANNSLQEYWNVKADATGQWSHCPQAPIIILCSEVLGLKPTMPGFAEYEIKPQLGDIGNIKATVHTSKGPFQFETVRRDDAHEMKIQVPPAGRGVVRTGEVSIPIETGAPLSLFLARNR
jgi:alpha-L-rhamnosidase